MAKEDNASKEEAWTTWEELLLACAVKRHGFKNWDSVAMEIQTRTSLSHLCISPQNCKLKYQDLKRRFAKTEDNSDTIPWLDELKKLRVAELRQEVHRSDVSIQSLQLKVKRLKEERENENDDEKPDLEMDPKKERSESDKNEINGEPEKSSSDRVAGKSDESDRENQSVNASNSTGGTKGENQEVGPEDERKESRPVQNNCRETDRVSGGSKPVGEDSYNASSDSIAKDLKFEVKKSELGNSVGESKRGEDEGKRESQSSDVQSSASLMKKKRRKEKVAGGNSGEELASLKPITVKSRPLVEILEIMRSHKHGSLFERRLQSQETSKYKKLIRQHMDLQTVQKRLDKGSYSSSPLRFYRDLLVLFNNAIIFFPKSSVESVTARELRNIVSNEMVMIKQNPTSTDSSPEVNTNPSPPIMPQQLKPKLERSDSLLPQDKSSGPIIVCRKRSSIAAAKKGGDEQNKPSSTAVKSSPPKLVEEEEEEKQVAIVKMKKKDTTVTGARSMRKINNKNQSTSPEKVDSGSNSKAEKKKSETTTSVLGAKKRSSSAADFLKRIKQNSPSEKWRKSSEDESKNSPEKKKRSHDKKVVVDGRKDREVRSNGKQGKGREEVRPNGKQGKEKEETSPSKRGVGRPPRKGADVVPVKRKRENGSREVEVEDPIASSKRPKKKTRR